MSSIAVVAFDPAIHGPWVYDSFRQSLADQWPWAHVRSAVLLNELKRALASPDTCALVAVAPDDPDAFLGWIAAVPFRNEVVFAFTKYAVRRMGVGSALARAADIALAAPVGLRYWTRAAERIGRRPGWHLYFRVTDEPKEKAA